jgi:hypothetical protein
LSKDFFILESVVGGQFLFLTVLNNKIALAKLELLFVINGAQFHHWLELLPFKLIKVYVPFRGENQVSYPLAVLENILPFYIIF